MLILTCFFFNDTATTEIYTRSIVGSVRCVQETDQRRVHGGKINLEEDKRILKDGDEEMDYDQLEAALKKEGSDFLKGFQRVFVEDLGEELIMDTKGNLYDCLLYTSPSPRDLSTSRMPSSA
eukprot:TRINITY_DN29345_c0_g1_i3.p1 TRINITY_DN29345_c0_g1~~TRINITY_DN29345_c0_g1_i3.p1  ORF type:complete len:122 (+),score=49.66 TRINITY_DN29345_c0_g1_i3:69-434(+)